MALLEHRRPSHVARALGTNPATLARWTARADGDAVAIGDLPSDACVPLAAGDAERREQGLVDAITRTWERQREVGLPVADVAVEPFRDRPSRVEHGPPMIEWHIATPMLSSARLTLRPYRSKDVRDVFDCITPAVTRFMSWEPPGSFAEHEARFEARRHEAFDKEWPRRSAFRESPVPRL